MKNAPPVPKFGFVKPAQNESMNMEIENFFAEIGQSSKPDAQKQPEQDQEKKEQRKQQPQKEIKDISKINDKLSSIWKKNQQLNQLNSVKLSSPPSKPSVSTPKPLTPISNKLEEYDPARPNDYEELKAVEMDSQERKMQEEVEKRKRKKSQTPETGTFSSLVEEEVQQMTSGEEKALKMMQKQGFKLGQGLGKNSQGMKTPLIAKKKNDSVGVITASSIDICNLLPQDLIVKNNLDTLALTATRVLLLLNIVTPHQVDDDLEAEIRTELAKYGHIHNCLIYMNPAFEEDLAVRVFVHFSSKEEAINAFLAVDGRVFDKRIVACRFYSEQSFEHHIYDDPIK